MGKDEELANQKKEAETKKPTSVCWTTGTKRIKDCGMYGDEKFVAFLPQIVHEKIRGLTREVGAKEWLGYLHGKYGEYEGDKIFFIDNISVPLQEVTAGSVDVIIPQANDEILGTVHLHPFGDNLWFSGTDDRYIAGNHPLTIVTNPSGEYKAQMKRVLPCGASFLAQGEVIVTTPRSEEVDDFVEHAIEYILGPKKIEKPEPAQKELPIDDDKWPNLYCAHCRKKVEPEKRRWLVNVMLCEECYHEEIGFDEGMVTNVP